MKISKIKTQIVKNYKKLHELTYIEQKDKRAIYLWQVNMNNWHASAVKNNVWYKNGLINAKINPNDSNVDIREKPFFMWDKWVLKRVNKALNNIVNNFNKDIVTKSQISFRNYTEEDIEKLKAASRVINQVIL